MYVSSHLDQLIIIFCCCIWTLLVRLYSEHLNLTSVFSPNVSNNHINHTQQVTNSSFFVYCVNHNQHKSLKITSSASLFTIIQLKTLAILNRRRDLSAVTSSLDDVTDRRPTFKVLWLAERCAARISTLKLDSWQ